MTVRKNAYRGVRKTANISRRVFGKVSRLSGQVEKKADRIIHGRDPRIILEPKISIEKYLSEEIAEINPIQPALPLAGRPGSVTLLLPSLQNSSFFGGTATALIVAAKTCVKKNLSLRILITLVSGTSSATSTELYEFFRSNHIELSNDSIEIVDISARRFDHYGYLDIHPDDIYIASAWWDAYLLQRLPLVKNFIYLIQDFEPIFYNNSDRYILAESTYDGKGYSALCNTRLMHDFMVTHGYLNKAPVTSFEPAVSYSSLVTKRGKAGKIRRMFIYGRPSVERNLFGLGLSALNECFNNHLAGDKWEVFMAGQNGISDIELSSGVVIKNLGKMNLQKYKEFMSTVDVTVSLMMAPHPNYPTLEFSSSGSAVVTTKYDLKTDLSMYSKNIIVSGISVDELAQSIVAASKIPLEERINNTRTSTLPATWHLALDKPLDKILATLKVLSENK